jgi:NAD+ synthase (glutamine-hydrolysing)
VFWFAAPSQDTTESELVPGLLTTVYQSTRNSSTTTQQAAAHLAQALGAKHFEVSVDDVVAAYCDKVEHLLGRPLGWQRDDLALQNIQARARAPLVWMLANAAGALLLSTSNRSEAAVGYATMDGDTAGGLSPIAGIDKAFLRRWLIFMQHDGLAELGPVPALSVINEQQPTAELRPAKYEQTDESDLMPYDVLDMIERAALYQRRSPKEVLEALINQFSCDRDTALSWLKRFYRLFSINQWKRERLAPSFFLDEGNLDPKTWLRFPILSGGFEYELAQLEEPSQPSS